MRRGEVFVTLHACKYSTFTLYACGLVINLYSGLHVCVFVCDCTCMYLCTCVLI